MIAPARKPAADIFGIVRRSQIKSGGLVIWLALDGRQTYQGGIRLFHPVIAGLCGCIASAVLNTAAWSGSRSAAHRSGQPAARRHRRPALPVLQRRNGRNYRRGFWRPYRSKPDADRAPRAGSNAPEGVDAHLFQYRPPIDLTNARLRMLAAALGPAYLRVSGTWANTTYFADTDRPPPLPPPGFKGILTRRQWRQVDPVFASGGRADRDVLRHRRRQPQCRWRLEPGSGPATSRLYPSCRWQDRRRRVHERTEPYGHGWRARRI